MSEKASSFGLSRLHRCPQRLQCSQDEAEAVPSFSTWERLQRGHTEETAVATTRWISNSRATLAKAHAFS